MSMHKSFRNDVQHSAGQVVTPSGAPVLIQGKTLQKEIEDYQQSLKLCAKYDKFADGCCHKTVTARCDDCSFK